VGDRLGKLALHRFLPSLCAYTAGLMGQNG
jgi:hypothetical protein